MTDRLYISRLVRQRYLNPNEEQRLISAWQNDGDLKARNRVVMAYMPMVARLALKFCRHTDAKADAVNEGSFGVMRAMDLYNVDGPTKFVTYAFLWARAEIIKFGMKSRSHLKISDSSKLRAMYFNFEQQKRKLGILGDYLSQTDLERLAQSFDCTPRTIIDLMNAVGHQASLQDTLSREEDDREAGVLCASNDPSPEDILQEQSVLHRRRKLLAEAIDTLKPGHREVFESYYLTGESVPMVDIAASRGVTRQAIEQTRKKALDKVQRYVSRHSE